MQGGYFNVDKTAKILDSLIVSTKISLSCFTGVSTFNVMDTPEKREK